MPIQWQSHMSVGNDDLDYDHRRLVELCNVCEELLAADDEAPMAGVMRDLVGLIAEHFDREEEILFTVGASAFWPHREAHDAVADRIHLLRRRWSVAADRAARRDIALALHTFIRTALVEHILSDDRILAHGSSTGTLPAGAQPAAAEPPASAPPPAAAAAAPEAVVVGAAHDVQYSLPPHLAHLLSRLNYATPALPQAKAGATSFDALFAEAVGRRVASVLVQFHKRNPAVERPLVPSFIHSPLFADRFVRAVGRLILPRLTGGRLLRNLQASCEWRSLDGDTFWDAVDDQLAADLLERWQAAWDDLKLVERRKEDGSRVLQVKEGMRLLREMLQPPAPDSYDLPRVGNQDIDVFKAFFDPTPDCGVALAAAWRRCHDLYEQEFEPRVFQQSARDGALRDYLLQAHRELGAPWGEFLLLTSYRVFGRITSGFLERFSTNLGRNDQERGLQMPYLMRVLLQVRDRPDIRRAEREAEARWQEDRRELQNVLKGITAAA